MLIKFHRNQFPAPCLSISSTTLELLDWIKLKIGMGMITHKKNYNSEKYKESYIYVLKYDTQGNLLTCLLLWKLDSLRSLSKFE